MENREWKVSFRDLVLACRKAHKEKRLGVQLKPNEHKYQCLYIYPKRPECGCAIGVGLPQDFREMLLAEASQRNCWALSSIVDKYNLKIEASQYQFRLLSKLQGSHDAWMSNDLGEELFLEQLEVCEKELMEENQNGPE